MPSWTARVLMRAENAAANHEIICHTVKPHTLCEIMHCAVLL
jgi:hypothetical protein